MGPLSLPCLKMIFSANASPNGSFSMQDMLWKNIWWKVCPSAQTSTSGSVITTACTPFLSLAPSLHHLGVGLKKSDMPVFWCDLWLFQEWVVLKMLWLQVTRHEAILMRLLRECVGLNTGLSAGWWWRDYHLCRERHSDHPRMNFYLCNRKRNEQIIQTWLPFYFRVHILATN